MFETVLRKRHFRDLPHRQNHSEQCFVCSWQENEVIWLFYMSVGVMRSTPRCSHTSIGLADLFWLCPVGIIKISYLQHTPVTARKHTHWCLGAVYKMVVTVKLSLFPLLSNKHRKKQFQRVVYPSALLSQDSEHLKSVIETEMKFLTKFTLEKKFGIFVQGIFDFQSYRY